MRSKAVTLRDVADSAGVSSTTASVVLGGRAGEFRIATETTERVHRAARQLGYQSRGGTRRSARTAPSPLWGVFAPADVDTAPVHQFLSGVSAFLTDHHQLATGALIAYERGMLRDKRPLFSPSSMQGAVLIGVDDDDDLAFVERESLDVPVVLYNRTARRRPSVLVDEYGVGKRVAEHFVARGLDSYAAVVPPVPTSASSLRLAGFSDGLMQLGLVGVDGVPFSRVAWDSSRHPGADKLFAPGTGRRGVFVLTDEMLPTVMAALDRADVAVPGDVEVVAYGNSTVSSLLRPSVTTMSVPGAAMGGECAVTLHQAILHPGSLQDIQRVFQAELVVRESSPAAAGTL